MEQWRDTGLVLSLRKIGEYDAIVTVITKHNGKISAVVKGAYSKRIRPILELGNCIDISFKRRTDTQIGVFTAELHKNFSNEVLHHSGQLNALLSICSLTDLCFTNGQDTGTFFDVFYNTCIAISSPYWSQVYCKWELLLLKESGILLDLEKCVVNKTTDNLMYVSPKSGCAVSQEAGFLYKNKLLPYPQFLQTQCESVTGQDIYDSLTLSGYFLKNILNSYHNKNLPYVREHLAEWFFNRKTKCDL